MRAAVDPIAVEDIRDRLHVAGGVAREAKRREEQQEGSQLAVDVAEDLARRRHVDDHRLAAQDRHHRRRERRERLGHLGLIGTAIGRLGRLTRALAWRGCANCWPNQPAVQERVATLGRPMAIEAVGLVHERHRLLCCLFDDPLREIVDRAAALDSERATPAAVRAKRHIKLQIGIDRVARHVPRLWRVPSHRGLIHRSAQALACR